MKLRNSDDDYGYELQLEPSTDNRNGNEERTSDWLDPVQVLIRRHDQAVVNLAEKQRIAKLQAACDALGINFIY